MAMKLVNLVSISTFILILVLPSTWSADNKYTACGMLLQCGNIKNIGYPFWGDSRPDYCGHPSFHLTDCQSDKSPVIEINDVAYRVLTIDTYIHSLRLVRSDYSDTVCPQYLHNGTMIKDYQFSYVDYTKDLIIYYNCTRGAGVLPQPNQFSCFSNGSFSESFYALSGVALIEGVSCESSVSVRVDSVEASNINTASFNTASFNVTQVIMNGFSLSWDAFYNDCEKCAQDGGRCGSSPSSSSLVCYARNESIGSKFRPPGIGFILIVVFGSITILTLILCVMRRYSRSLVSCMERPGNEEVDEFVRIYGSFAPKRYTYLNVKKITNSFNEKLGQGGCGVVYKGKLPDGRQVAVKVLSETKENREDFFNEVVSIGRTSHVNIVTLLGFCFENNKRALIYEYMVRGSLEKAVREKLEWTTLYQIAIGVAHGLEYLHRGCNTRIVHFDIKPHNILLDENLHPKISDFGLAKLLQSQQSKISMLVARGTAGYIAPEVLSRAFGPVSHKSDVYSYGMLLIEMTGAEKNKKGVVLTSEMYFPDWIYEHLERDEDLDFHGVTNKEDEEMAKKMVVVGLWCIQTNPLDRPPISQVVNMLKGDLESLQIPPKPVLFSPPIAYLNSENSSQTLSSSIANVPEKEG